MSLSVLFFHLQRWAASAVRSEWIVNPLRPACSGASYFGWLQPGQPGLCAATAIPWLAWHPSACS